MLGNGPMQDYTTQKHDYVAKPLCKREPIVNETHLENSDAPLENTTIQKMSFLPPASNDLAMVKSFRPFYQYKRPDGNT